MHRSIIFQGCCWEDLSHTISFLFSFFPMHYFFSLRKLEDALFTSSVLKFHNNVLGVGFFFPSVVPGTWWKWTLWSWNMCLLVLGFVCSCVYLFLGFIYLFIYDLCSWWLLPSISGFSLNFLLFRYWIPWITHLEFSHVSFSIFQFLVFCSIFWKISWKFVSHTFVEFIISVAIFFTPKSFFFFSDGSVLKNIVFVSWVKCLISLRIVMNWFWRFYFPISFYLLKIILSCLVLVID